MRFYWLLWKTFVLFVAVILIGGCHDDGSNGGPSSQSYQLQATLNQPVIYSSLQSPHSSLVTLSLVGTANLQTRVANNGLSHPVEISGASIPFSITDNQCASGLAEGGSCTFKITYKPQNITTDSFKKSVITVVADSQTIKVAAMGAPASLMEANSPIRVIPGVNNSLNFGAWLDDVTHNYNYTLANTSGQQLTDVHLKATFPPNGVTYSPAIVCNTGGNCPLGITYNPSALTPQSDGFAVSAGSMTSLSFNYAGFAVSYELDHQWVNAYGHNFLVNPFFDLGQFNGYSTGNKTLIVKQYGNIILSGGEQGLAVSSNNGKTWHRVPGIYNVLSLTVSGNHVLVGTNDGGLVVGDYNSSTGAITNPTVYNTNSTVALPTNRVLSVTVSGNHVLVGTNGGGLVVGDYNSSTGAITNPGVIHRWIRDGAGTAVIVPHH